MSGWQKPAGRSLWHFFAPRYYGFSICLKFQKDERPLESEPGSLLICEACVREMRRTVRQIERRDMALKLDVLPNV